MLLSQSGRNTRVNIVFATTAALTVILLVQFAWRQDSWRMPGIHSHSVKGQPIKEPPNLLEEGPLAKKPDSLLTGSSGNPIWNGGDNSPTKPLVHSTPSALPLPSLPTEYVEVQGDSDWCEAGFSTQYLHKLASAPKEMCASGISSLECFSVKPWDRKDSFCIAKNVLVDTAQQKLSLDCQMLEESQKEFEAFPEYIWWTGVRKIMDTWFRLNHEAILEERIVSLQCGVNDKRRGNQSTAVVFLRDGGANMWHSLMEVYSYYQSMDALSIAFDRKSEPYFDRLQDTKDLQVIWVDEKRPGPYAQLWDYFSSKPAIHLKDLESTRTCYDRVIVPLPGGSNTMWAGDWEVRDCTNSTMLNAFKRRVLSYLQVPEPHGQRPTTVTFVDRKQTRALHNQHVFIQKLERKYPDIRFQTFDLQETNFTNHLRIARETDLLVGTHGAGLTSTWFLPSRSSVVEILPPDFWHKGFRNLANLMGHRYFSAHATLQDGQEAGAWHEAPYLYIEEQRFMLLMDMAIASLQNVGTRNMDAV